MQRVYIMGDMVIGAVLLWVTIIVIKSRSQIPYSERAYLTDISVWASSLSFWRNLEKCRQVIDSEMSNMTFENQIKHGLSPCREKDQSPLYRKKNQWASSLVYYKKTKQLGSFLISLVQQNNHIYLFALLRLFNFREMPVNLPVCY